MPYACGYCGSALEVDGEIVHEPECSAPRSDPDEPPAAALPPAVPAQPQENKEDTEDVHTRRRPTEQP